ncbi:oxoglutarate-dependent flavonoid 7-O-demethylase 1-like [Mercurialis annua]|uniref:oxoglutarate-dependent flavonoid 7-O-demethylase 1-like n=1 Tax=Mercurialis annua TaxID=3986 RepID=UPI00215E48E3|nr:oxoglutarate-dependent flavonoid 7-O-demethylase 1-like [Mercurialis annua]
MAMVPKNLAWSLKVPSVQELARQKLEIVPVRYVRDDLIVNTPSDLSLSVPLIDMTNLVNPRPSRDELHKLHSACKHWGVFQLINHGVSIELLSNMKKQVREFFDLPLQDKEQWGQKP